MKKVFSYILASAVSIQSTFCYAMSEGTSNGRQDEVQAVVLNQEKWDSMSYQEKLRELGASEVLYDVLKEDLKNAQKTADGKWEVRSQIWGAKIGGVGIVTLLGAMIAETSAVGTTKLSSTYLAATGFALVLAGGLIAVTGQVKQVFTTDEKEQIQASLDAIIEYITELKENMELMKAVEDLQ